jgi:hypothetical protein
MQKTSMDTVTSAGNQKALLNWYVDTGQLRPNVGQGDPRYPSTVRDTLRHVQPDLDHQDYNILNVGSFHDLRPPTLPPPKDDKGWSSQFWESSVGKAIWDGLGKLGGVVHMDAKTVGWIMLAVFGGLLLLVLV